MTPADLLAHTRSQPFQPFRIVLVDGQSYDIERPDRILVGRREALVGNPNGTGTTFYDISQQIALRHIRRVEPLTPTSVALP